MDNDRIGELLVRIGRGERQAFRALFDEVGPAVAGRVAALGVPRHAAADGLERTFVQIWEGEYVPPSLTHSGKGADMVQWLGGMVMDHASTKSETPQQPLTLDDDLWSRIEKEAYPESPRNILRRLDVLFAIAAAAVWAVLLLLLTPS